MDKDSKKAIIIIACVIIFVVTMFLTGGRLYKTKTTYVKQVEVISFEEELAGSYNSATASRFVWVQDEKLKYKIEVSYELSEKLNNGDTVTLVEEVNHYKLFNFDRVKRTIVEKE